jgi:proline racemase
VPVVAGQAWITGIYQMGLDPTDPFPTGFTLPDTWLGRPGDPRSSASELLPPDLAGRRGHYRPRSPAATGTSARTAAVPPATRTLLIA